MLDALDNQHGPSDDGYDSLRLDIIQQFNLPHKKLSLQTPKTKETIASYKAARQYLQSHILILEISAVVTPDPAKKTGAAEMLEAVKYLLRHWIPPLESEPKYAPRCLLLDTNLDIDLMLKLSNMTTSNPDDLINPHPKKFRVQNILSLTWMVKYAQKSVMDGTTEAVHEAMGQQYPSLTDKEIETILLFVKKNNLLTEDDER